MEQIELRFLLIIECATENISQYIIQIDPMYYKSLGLMKKCIFEHCRKVKHVLLALFAFSVLPSISLFWYYIKMCSSIKDFVRPILYNADIKLLYKLLSLKVVTQNAETHKNAQKCIKMHKNA
jgi:hypothetical protein